MRDIETPANAPGEGVAPRPRRPREETARLGREIYERDIRGQVEADHHGEVVAIDVDSKEWAVAVGEIAAVDRLRAMRPSAVNVLCERVGYRALPKVGPHIDDWHACNPEFLCYRCASSWLTFSR